MTGEQKIIITKQRMHGCGYATIAKSINLSVNTVKSFCRRNNLTEALIKGTVPVCHTCGAVLAQPPKVKRKRFCSENCRRVWWKTHPELSVRKAYYEKVCSNCGKVYTVYGRPNSKYCSLDCAHHGRTQKAEAVV